MRLEQNALDDEEEEERMQFIWEADVVWRDSHGEKEVPGAFKPQVKVLPVLGLNLYL